MFGARVYEHRTLTATLILNLEDAYARSRLGQRSHPRPMEPLRFWIVERTAGGVAQQFEPPWELVVVRNASGYHLFFGQQRLPGGNTRQLTLPSGRYVLRVTSPLYQTAEKAVDLPLPNPNQPGVMDVYSLDLVPGYLYPFPDVSPARAQAQAGCTEDPFPGRRGPTLLRGTLRSVDGKGIVGAQVEVAGISNTYRTDDTGQWVLWFPDAHPTGPVTVHFVLPHAAAVDVSGVCVIRGRETSLHETALRGWVQKSGVGIPDAVVTVAGHQGQTRSGSDGSWVYVFPFDQGDEIVTITASLPHGTQQTQQGISVVRRATALVPTFNLP